MKTGQPSQTALLVARGVYFMSRERTADQGELRQSDLRQGDLRQGDLRQSDLRQSDLRQSDLLDGGAVSLVPLEAAWWSARFLCAASPRAHRLLRWCDRRWFRSLVRLVERKTIPGILHHYVARKRWLEDYVRHALANGATQVVILGAGFDTLGVRLSGEFPDVTFIEFDHGDTQRIKARAVSQTSRRHRRRDSQHANTPSNASLNTLSNSPSTVSSNFHLRPLDLSRDRITEQSIADQSIAEHLSQCPAYRADRNTVFVAEGLLMYLETSVVETLFRDLAHACTDKSCTAPVCKAPATFAWTFLEPQPDGSINFSRRSRLVDWWLKRRGEPFLWGIERSQLESWLEAQGWSLRAVAQVDVSVDTDGTTDQPHGMTGEWMAVAEIHKAR